MFREPCWYRQVLDIEEEWRAVRVGSEYLGRGLEILPTKTNGLRDVMTGTLGQAGKNLTNVTFHFDGAHYVVVKDTTHKQR